MMKLTKAKRRLILEQVALGKTLEQIAKEHDSIHLETVHRWLVRDGEFCREYFLARDQSAIHDEEKLQKISDLALNGTVDPAAARVSADILKHLATIKRPDRHSQKQLGSASQPISLVINKLMDDPEV